jgi:hypothetical protein
VEMGIKGALGIKEGGGGVGDRWDGGVVGDWGRQWRRGSRERRCGAGLGHESPIVRRLE